MRRLTPLPPHLVEIAALELAFGAPPAEVERVTGRTARALLVHLTRQAPAAAAILSARMNGTPR